MAPRLLPQAEAVLNLAPKDRILFIRGIGSVRPPNDRREPEELRGPIIAHERLSKILTVLDDLLAYPRIGRMPCLLITAESNSGKSTIIRYFAREHWPTEEDEGLSFSVVLIEAPSNPDEKQLWVHIIDALMGPVKRSSRIDQLQYQAKHLLREAGVKMLIIDEFHHLVTGSVKRTQQCLHAIKSLSNELGISIVGAGLPEAFASIKGEPQMANRFDRIQIKGFGPNDEYCAFLSTLEQLLPLKKPSLLSDASIANYIMKRTHGVIGEICRLTLRAAVMAIKMDAECIDLALLRRVPYVEPTDRIMKDDAEDWD